MRLFSALSFALLAACSGTSGSSVTTASPTIPSADLGGSWAGRATALGESISVTAELVQNGDSLGGSVRALGGCIEGGKVSGTVNGDNVSASVTAGDVFVTLNMTISSDDQLDGTFDLAASGACPAQQGSISLTRK